GTAFLTVPGPAAQAAADAVVRAGITGILNFVPTVVSTPPEVWVETVDFLAALKRLAYYLNGREPVVDKRVVDEPVVDERVVDERVVDEPLAGEPGVDVGA